MLFLNCLEANPCWTWLNSNKTVRDTGDARAANLSAVLPQIIKTKKYQNFDMIYYPFPINEIEKIWNSRGGQLWQLIEPVDGFHPNQQFNALLGEFLWNSIAQDRPSWLGNVNPNNDQISFIFGDQGGY